MITKGMVKKSIAIVLTISIVGQNIYPVFANEKKEIERDTNKYVASDFPTVELVESHIFKNVVIKEDEQGNFQLSGSVSEPSVIVSIMCAEDEQYIDVKVSDDGVLEYAFEAGMIPITKIRLKGLKNDNKGEIVEFQVNDVLQVNEEMTPVDKKNTPTEEESAQVKEDIVQEEASANQLKIANNTSIAAVDNRPTLSDINIDVKAGKYNVTAKAHSVYGIARVEFPTWTEYKGQDDILWKNGVLTGDMVTFAVDMKDHNYETGAYTTHIYVYDNLGNSQGYALSPQIINNSKPEIKDVRVDNIGGRYTITATVTDDYKLDRVEFPTWTTQNGQDDLTWEKGTISGNSVTYTVDMKDHKNETGEYATHIYVYDAAGKSESFAIPLQMISKSKPTITNVQVNNLGGRYTITAKVTDDYKLERVEFPTWTIKNGQDDLTWEKGIINGDMVSYTVDMQDHNREAGEYVTHIYAYDVQGECETYAVPIQSITNSKPTISDVSIAMSAGKYTITAKVTDDYAVARVEFPTWTSKQGQDDIVWSNGSISGDIVTFTVDMKNHNYETGEYITHVYAYDTFGKCQTYIIAPQMIRNSDPVISNVNVENSEGKYVITAKITDDYKIDKVEFPTWTTKNGQDDLTWEKGSIKGDIVTYTVDMSNHKFETGEYLTHIYAYDVAGNYTTYRVPSQNIYNSKPTISNLKIINKDAGGYTIQADVFDEYGIDRVEFPTWTIKNGQDDITWQSANVIDGVVTYRVNIDSHKFELGPYLTDIYAYDKAGVPSTYNIPQQKVNNVAPVISNIRVEDVTEWGYTVKATVKDDNNNIDYVEFPTWTTKNDKDDITWERGLISGDTVSYRVDISKHNFEAGEYITNMYAFDKSGNGVGEIVSPVNIAFSYAPGWRVMSGKKYLIDNNGEIVNGATKYIIDISEHNGDIDWEKVKASGVDGVILRCGYGWADDLNEQIDKKFIKNAKELERLGIPYGVYLFSYVNTESGAAKEANYTLRLLEGRKISLPVYYDLEYSSYAGDISQSTYVRMATVYCDIIQSAGYTPGIYANLNYWNNKLNSSSLDKYQKWVAQYNVNNGNAGYCDYNKPYKMWQYTSVGRVPGINTNVDLNAWY